MPSRGVIVSALLCCIIQVTHIPSVLGLDGQLHDSSTNLVQTLLKRSLSSQGLLERAAGPELVNLTLKATLHEITASWALKNWSSSAPIKFRVTTTGVDKIVSGNSFNISGLACKTSFTVKVSPVDNAGKDFGLSKNAIIITNGVAVVANLTLLATTDVITARWSLNEPKCFPNMKVRVITEGVNQIVSQSVYNISGLACNTSYNVKVTPVDAGGFAFGVPANAIINTKGVVPELANLTLQAINNDINAIWSLKNPKCFPNGRFRVTAAGVDKIVTENSYIITGLACNTTHNVKVSPVDANGANYGVSRNASIWKKGVPELLNLTLESTKANEITVRWLLSESKCFPGMKFRVTTAGVNTTVSGNSYNITGLACDTLYTVKVAPTNAAGAEIGGFMIASNRTSGALVVSANPMVAETLVVKWRSVGGDCSNYSDYEVSVSELKGPFQLKNITKKVNFIFAGLNASTYYIVRVQPRNSLGVLIGRVATALQMTAPASSLAGRCPFPTLAVAYWTGTIMCAAVEKPTPSTNVEANGVCQKNHPPTTEVPFSSVLYLADAGWLKYENMQEYLRMFGYTETLLMNGYYNNGSWVWGFGANRLAGTYPVNPALLVGLPAGGEGPDDYKMLYADPAKDFRLSVAKNGQAFGGMICAFPIKA